MKSFISKLGLTLVALALVLAPTLTLAQTALTVDITSPSNGAEVNVNQAVSFTAQASGGVSPITYGWTFSEGPQLSGPTVSKTFTSTGVKTISVRATDRNLDSATKNIQVTVVDGSAECSPLIIENGTGNEPRVTNLTSNSATIVWETCEPSTSRVVYGTAQVTDAVAADDTSNNRGYQTSSSLDENKVTSHSVQLTGLEANTTYYFRVLSAR
ncbi:MAG TPA: fibronectin type III domain-containing protein [Candidatus Paceibacterota bacterium]